jgi:hypothetical protein
LFVAVGCGAAMKGDEKHHRAQDPNSSSTETFTPMAQATPSAEREITPLNRSHRLYSLSHTLENQFYATCLFFTVCFVWRITNEIHRRA